MRAHVAILMVVLAWTSPALAASGDNEAWGSIEYRLPIVKRPPGFPRTSWRVIAEARLKEPDIGLYQMFIRTGPMLDVTRWMFIAVHGTAQADRLADGQFDQEFRLELEPNLYGRVGPITFNDRNRLEYRWRDSGVTYRYRNQLRVNYAPEGAVFIPFAWDEILIDLSGGGLNQNRFVAGLAVMLEKNVRLDLGGLWRARLVDDVWVHDVGVNVSLLVDVPPLGP